MGGAVRAEHFEAAVSSCHLGRLAIVAGDVPLPFALFYNRSAKWEWERRQFVVVEWLALNERHRVILRRALGRQRKLKSLTGAAR